MSDNTLYFGDNLKILRSDYIRDESVDLIYLDPPFQSGRNYNVIFKERDGSGAAGQIKAFEDTWRWDRTAAELYHDTVEEGGEVSRALQAFHDHLLGNTDMMAYLANMAPRLKALKRVLKPTGSIYLHCDPTASHYLKILLDSVFGPTNFRNEIVWRRTNAHNSTKYQYGPIHDVILFYTKTDDFTFHPGRRPYTKAYIEDRFRYDDERGRYQKNYLTGPGTRDGESGEEWGGYDPTSAGRHWAIPRSLRKFLPERGEGMSSHEQLDMLYDKDLIVFPDKEGGQPMYKQYVGPGVPYQDVWAYQPNTRGVLYETNECIDEDVKYLEDEDEKLGYETQKPEGVLQRIIETSSDEGDVVLDPFLGGGTTAVVAEKMNRNWIGIDVTYQAISITKRRLKDTFEGQVDYDLIGEPTNLPDARELAKHDRHQFELWALDLVDARHDGKKKGADKGIDGRQYIHNPESGETFQIVYQVKSGSVGPKVVRELSHVREREDANIGVLITLEDPTRAMKKEAADDGFWQSPWGKHPRLQILTVKELLEGARVDRPYITGADRTFNKSPRHVQTESSSEQGKMNLQE